MVSKDVFIRILSKDGFLSILEDEDDSSRRSPSQVEICPIGQIFMTLENDQLDSWSFFLFFARFFYASCASYTKFSHNIRSLKNKKWLNKI